MNEYNELIAVTATAYEPGERIGYQALLDREHDLWWFAQKGALSVWEALDCEADRDACFGIRAVHFAVTPVLNPTFTCLEWVSRLHQLIDTSGVEAAFKGSLDALMDVVERKRVLTPRQVSFIGIWSVTESEARGLDDLSYVQINVQFLGEMDTNALTLSTSRMEMAILRTLAKRGETDAEVIARHIQIDSLEDRFWGALAALKNDGLISHLRAPVAVTHYALTDAGRALVNGGR